MNRSTSPNYRAYAILKHIIRVGNRYDGPILPLKAIPWKISIPKPTLSSAYHFGYSFLYTGQ